MTITRQLMVCWCLLPKGVGSYYFKFVIRTGQAGSCSNFIVLMLRKKKNPPWNGSALIAFWLLQEHTALDNTAYLLLTVHRFFSKRIWNIHSKYVFRSFSGNIFFYIKTWSIYLNFELNQYSETSIISLVKSFAVSIRGTAICHAQPQWTI